MQKHIILLALITLAIFAACDPKINEIDNKEIPEKNISFSEHLQVPIETKCGYSGCHDLHTAAGSYQLIGYNNITQPTLVTKGSPEASKLVWVINGQYPVQMPPIGSPTAPLTKAQVDGIIQWIKEGAEDN